METSVASRTPPRRWEPRRTERGGRLPVSSVLRTSAARPELHPAVGTVIYGDVVIGDYFQSGHYAVIRAKVQMGGLLHAVQPFDGRRDRADGERRADHVAHVHSSRTWFGDHVFVGPGVTFLNDRYPGRIEPKPGPRGATIEDDVMIGGGCTILRA